MVKHTQAIRRHIVDELFEFVWPFCEIGAWRVKSWCFINSLLQKFCCKNLSHLVDAITNIGFLFRSRLIFLVLVALMNTNKWNLACNNQVSYSVKVVSQEEVKKW